MVDWYNLIANTLWITALALVLSVLSFVRWEAINRGQKFWKVLGANRWLATLTAAGVFFYGGLAALADSFWEQVVWLVLVVTFSTLTSVLLFARRKS